MEVIQVGGEAGIKVRDLYRVKYNVDVGMDVGMDVGVDMDMDMDGQPHIGRQWHVLRINYWT